MLQDWGGEVAIYDSVQIASSTKKLKAVTQAEATAIPLAARLAIR